MNCAQERQQISAVSTANIVDGFCGGFSDGFCGDFYSGFDGRYGGSTAILGLVS
jgi:hypothetical protein